MTPATCSFLATSHAPGVHHCTDPATHTVQDRRPLPDGTLRPPMPSCEDHAVALLAANGAAYMITFGLWAVA